MAKKKPVTSKGSTKTTKASKKNVPSNISVDEKNIENETKEVNINVNEPTIVPTKKNKHIQNKLLSKIHIKWVIASVIILLLISFYYFQSEQNDNAKRSQLLEIEQQLEKFQTKLTENLVNSQNVKIEEINKDLDKLLQANALLSEQNRSLSEKISKITNSEQESVNGSEQKINQSSIKNLEKENVQTKKLLIAIAKAQKTVETLELALEANKLENNLSVNMNALLSALNTGSPFLVPLSNIASQLDLQVSKNLEQKAVIGIKTINDLQNTFPQNARKVLKETGPIKNSNGLKEQTLSFIKSHIIIRSLQPIAGNNENAILSRAEMSLRLNNLDQALNELNELSKKSKVVMTSWLQEARTSHEVKKELDKIFMVIKQMQENND